MTRPIRITPAVGQQARSLWPTASGFGDADQPQPLMQALRSGKVSGVVGQRRGSQPCDRHLPFVLHGAPCT